MDKNEKHVGQVCFWPSVFLALCVSGSLCFWPSVFLALCVSKNFGQLKALLLWGNREKIPITLFTVNSHTQHIATLELRCVKSAVPWLTQASPAEVLPSKPAADCLPRAPSGLAEITNRTLTLPAHSL